MIHYQLIGVLYFLYKNLHLGVKDVKLGHTFTFQGLDRCQDTDGQCMLTYMQCPIHHSFPTWFQKTNTRTSPQVVDPLGEGRLGSLWESSARNAC